MTDELSLAYPQSVQGNSGAWYRCLRPLGKGKNASAFLVLATSGGHHGLRFALKMFRRISSEDSSRRFLKETEFLKDCLHPCVLPVFDDGIFLERHPFMIAEYLPETLRDTFSRDVPLNEEEKVCFILQLLSALHYLSKRDRPIVHCDLKPENIFVNGASCLLGDFGLLQSVGSMWIDRTNPPPMPRKYRTPDLVAFARGEAPLTAKSDVYQLGLVAAEIFTGHNPLSPLDSTSNTLESPLIVNAVEKIPGEQGGLIASLINRILNASSDQRGSIDDQLIGWETVLNRIVESSANRDVNFTQQ